MDAIDFTHSNAAEVRPAGGQMNDRAVISYHLNI